MMSSFIFYFVTNFITNYKLGLITQTPFKLVVFRNSLKFRKKSTSFRWLVVIGRGGFPSSLFVHLDGSIYFHFQNTFPLHSRNSDMFWNAIPPQKIDAVLAGTVTSL